MIWIRLNNKSWTQAINLMTWWKYCKRSRINGLSN